MLAKPEQCVGCAFYRIGKGYVPGAGPLNAVVAALGQSPGATEIATGKPFHPKAPSGRLLTTWLDLTGFPRETVWIDNSIRCLITNPEDGKDEAPLAAIQECQRRHWGPQLRNLPFLRAVITLGVPATWPFLPWASARTAGTFNLVDVEI